MKIVKKKLYIDVGFVLFPSERKFSEDAEKKSKLKWVSKAFIADASS
jgi:hypothetical protein